VKNPFKKIPWKKVGTAALVVASGVVPGGTAVGKAIQVFREVQQIDSEPLKGPEKKADVLAKVNAATPQIALAISQLIDAIVAVRKAWDALKAAYTAVR
jgi:hypothetical protein